MTPTAHAPAVLVYARQSKDNKSSISQQEELGRGRAEDEGWTIREVHKDGEGASRYSAKQRKEWPKVLAALAQPEVNILWLWESSRGDRKLATWAGMLDRCREFNVRIYVETHERLYNLNNPRDWKTLAEDGVTSQSETDWTSDRVCRAVRANAKQGKVHGRIPYGYRREYGINEKGKRILVRQYADPSEAAVIKSIFIGIQQGKSLRSMAAELNEREIPTVTGTAWTPQRLRDIALAPVYAGKRQHVPGATSGHARRQEEVQMYDGIWEGIVSVAQFNDVHRLLTDPKRRTSRPGRAKHLLSMIATCDVCEGVLIARFSRVESGEYICRNKSCVRVPKDELDDFIEDLMLEILAKPDEYRHLADGDGNDEQVQTARDEVAAVQAHYDDLKDLTRTRRMTASAFADMEPGVLEDLARATKRATELETPSQLRTLLGDFEVGQDLHKKVRDMTPVARRTLVRLLFARIAVKRSPSAGHRSAMTDRVDVLPSKRLQPAST
jgi:DNA invertase Pin-like site-specific DNA recombinase